MAIQPGALRHRVTLHEPTTTPDEGGGAAAGLRTVAMVWAAVEPLDGTEALRGMALQATVTHRIRMRYRAGVHAGMQASFRGRAFHFRRVVDVGERRAELEILAEEMQ